MFLETAVETDSAYVQQTVGYVVRLYFMPATLLDGHHGHGVDTHGHAHGSGHAHPDAVETVHDGSATSVG